jgi:hypothetical protein
LDSHSFFVTLQRSRLVDALCGFEGASQVGILNLNNNNDVVVVNGWTPKKLPFEALFTIWTPTDPLRGTHGPWHGMGSIGHLWVCLWPRGIEETTNLAYFKKNRFVDFINSWKLLPVIGLAKFC